MKKKMFLMGLLVLGVLGVSGVYGNPVQAAVVQKDELQAQDVPSKVLEVTPSKVMVDYIPDVVYEQVSTLGRANEAMKMDVMKPQGTEKRPAIVFVTGGGFIQADRANCFQLRTHMAEHGYVVASISYRVAPTARFPEPLEDVKAAIRYLRANADKFNIDPERIGIVGDSAGGYLSAFAGTTSGMKDFDRGENLSLSSAVKCAVDIYGLSDLTKVGADFSPAVQEAYNSAGSTQALWVNGSTVFGGKDGGVTADPEAAEKANPIHYINKNSAPMLLLHGTEDKMVSPSQTNLLFQALQKNGIPSERYLVKGAQHGGQYWVQDKVLNIITDFLDKYLQ